MEHSKMDEITKALSEMKFSKKFLGGVDELDVWKHLEQLQMYQKGYESQAAYYQGILDEKEARIQELQKREGAR